MEFKAFKRGPHNPSRASGGTPEPDDENLVGNKISSSLDSRELLVAQMPSKQGKAQLRQRRMATARDSNVSAPFYTQCPALSEQLSSPPGGRHE